MRKLKGPRCAKVTLYFEEADITFQVGSENPLLRRLIAALDSVPPELLNLRAIMEANQVCRGKQKFAFTFDDPDPCTYTVEDPDPDGCQESLLLNCRDKVLASLDELPDDSEGKNQE